MCPSVDGPGPSAQRADLPPPSRPSLPRPPPARSTPTPTTTTTTTTTTTLDRANALAYTLITAIALGALARVTGVAALATCGGIALVYGGAAALAARGGRTYARVRTPMTVALRILFVSLHNLAIVLSAGPRKGQPEPSWKWFWSTRTGPMNVFILSASTGLPRGRALATMLAGQAAAVALTQRVACAHLLRAYPLLAYYFVRLVDVWNAVGRASLAAVLGGWNGGDGGGGGGGGGGGVGSLLPPPPGAAQANATVLLPPAARAECATHACRFVMTLLYTGVGGVVWLLAPRRGRAGTTTPPPHHTRGRSSTDALDAALAGGLAACAAALGTWVGLAVLLPRPACCGGGAAAAAAWEDLVVTKSGGN